MAPAREVAVQVTGLGVTANDRRILHNVSFTVLRGELVVIVGENGAGKSTMASALAGVLKPSAGTIDVGPSSAKGTRKSTVAAVWQEPALCDDMTAEENLFLGREIGGFFLRRGRMRRSAESALDSAGFPAADLSRRVGDLSGGRRQALALATAIMSEPEILILDEPTSALGLVEQERFEQLLLRLRSAGTTIILISHRVEQVVALADRVLALRHGRLVADATTVELTTDDIVSLMSGLESGVSARRHLVQLSDLVDQLSDVEPSAALPLIISAIANTFTQQQFCVHLVAPNSPDTLSMAASIGMPHARRAALQSIPIAGDLSIALSYRTGGNQVTDSLPAGTSSAGTDGAHPTSMWSVPIMGSAGAVLGVITGLADVPGRPQPDQLAMVSLYAGLAATSIERERLLRDVTRNNRMLASLRRIIDTLSEVADPAKSFAAALVRLGSELAAERVVVARISADGEVHPLPEGYPASPIHAPDLELPMTSLVPPADSRDALGEVYPVGSRVLAVQTLVAGERMLFAAQWPPNADYSEAADLVRNAAWSLSLSLQRELSQQVLAEAEALSRTSALQREFVHRLSHELRTPLTAIIGYASSLNQTDITWEASAQRRFIDVISAESARMHRLVKDLLDSSTLAAGGLPIVPDWADLSLIVEAASSAVDDSGMTVSLALRPTPPVWADHDRIEQVLINVLDNSIRHGANRVWVRSESAVIDGSPAVRIVIEDDGPGIGSARGHDLFEPYVNGSTPRPGLGLGLAIAKGIVDAHHGTIEFLSCDGGASVAVTLPVEFDAHDPALIRE